MIGESFLHKTLFFAVLSLGLSLSLRAQDCPEQAEFQIVHEQTPNGNDGQITVTFSGLQGDMTPGEQKFQYSLWNREVNGYIHNPAHIDPGFHEDLRVTASFLAPGTITFKNLPPRSGYVIVLTSSSCQKTFIPETGEITVKAFNQ